MSCTIKLIVSKCLYIIIHRVLSFREKRVWARAERLAARVSARRGSINACDVSKESEEHGRRKVGG